MGDGRDRGHSRGGDSRYRDGTNPVPLTPPAAFRPAATVYIPVNLCDATSRRLEIQPDGTVTVQAENGSFSNAVCFTSLDGASFAP